MIERLKSLRKNILSLSQEEFANSIGLKKSAISDIERGKAKLTERNLQAICQTFDVNEDWLRNGIEPIFKEKVDDALQEVFEQYGLSDFMQDIVTRYLGLDKELQEAFEKFLKGMMEEQKLPVNTIKKPQIRFIANEEDAKRFELEEQKKIQQKKAE